MKKLLRDRLRKNLPIALTRRKREICAYATTQWMLSIYYDENSNGIVEHNHL